MPKTQRAVLLSEVCLQRQLSCFGANNAPRSTQGQPESFRNVQGQTFSVSTKDSAREFRTLTYIIASPAVKSQAPPSGKVSNGEGCKPRPPSRCVDPLPGSPAPRRPPAPRLPPRGRQRRGCDAPGAHAPEAHAAHGVRTPGPDPAPRPEGPRLALHRPLAPGEPPAQDRGPRAPTQASSRAERREAAPPQSEELKVRAERPGGADQLQAPQNTGSSGSWRGEGRLEKGRSDCSPEQDLPNWAPGAGIPASAGGERPRGRRLVPALGAGLLLSGVPGAPGRARRAGSPDEGCARLDSFTSRWKGC